MKTHKAPVHVKEAARVTRQLLEARGWIQGAFHRAGDPARNPKDSGGYCLLGAIDASVPTPDQNALKSYLNRVFAKKWKKKWVSVAEWNDARGRTKKEVLAVLREVEKS